MSIDYSNPPLTYDEQIDLLRQRGITVENIESTKWFLNMIGFQTFLNYAKFYEINNKKFHINELPIVELSLFDIKLKNYLFQSLTLFEMKFREAWAYHLSHQHGICAYKDESLYKNKIYFYQSISKLFQDIENSKNPSIIQKRNIYNIESLPNYVVKDVFSFGQISKHFNNLAVPKTCNLIGQEFGLEGDVLKSWINLFVEVRNIIAHHNILWNRTMVVQPQLPRSKPVELVGVFNHHSKKLYNVLSMLDYIETKIMNSNNNELLVHLLQHPQFLPAMGFPPDWRDKPIWNINKETA